ncbi:FAD/NAD(P)-binding protein [Streptomyces sp. J2-1]|uniref:FAD/NAD(P)-binding protein n=1 Tax=Streptomyces corallincola TaxID=2851888 RepID=UPI001C3924FF|nr:FAD/NAD(P)-binding protein [Streptomyces corallincola]MBV2354690.1 FAD/NAD(P)-binding protein [Streptomyces corallincola]
MAESTEPPLVIAVIGAGLYGLSTVERLVANSTVYVPDRDRQVHIHLIDPFLGQGSRTWSVAQPAQLWMNSHAGLMTLFTDDFSSCAGPVRKGPTLQEWAAAHGETLSVDETLDRLVDGVSPYRWATRSSMGKYMTWFLDHVCENAPANVHVHRHRDVAVEVVETPDSPQGGETVRLAGETIPLRCHRVVLAQGRPASEPTAKQREMQAAMSSQGAGYEPPGPAALSKTAHIKPGEGVLLRGLGLTFFDYLQLFTTVRGGSFRRVIDGSLTYEPSGDEPRIYATSRSGVPAHPLPWWPVSGSLAKCATPRFTSPRLFADLARSRDTAGALQEITARMRAELLYFYYAELLTSDPERYADNWDRFRQPFLACAPGSPAQDEVIASVVPDEDRLDLDHLVDPLRGRKFSDLAALQSWMRRYVARVTNRSLTRERSCDLALRAGLSYLTSAIGSAVRSNRSEAVPEFYRGAWEWVRARVAVLTGGAPWPRQLELQALSRCGVLTFLGQETWMTDEPAPGALRFASGTVPERVNITHVIEARRQQPSVVRTRDDLLRSLHERGEVAWRETGRSPDAPSDAPQTIVVTRHGSLISRDRRVSGTRYAVGADTSYPIQTPGLPRAGTDSDVFHMTDRVARHALESIVRNHTDATPEG